ncbi:MAG: glycosyltransferase family 1 protein [Nitrospirota bacterium]
MMVGIDAGPMVGRGGISGYVGPLVRTLIANHPRTEFRLLLRRGWLDVEAVSELKRFAPVQLLRIPDRAVLFWWDRLGKSLPVQRRFWSSLDLYLATCLVAPVLPRGQVISIVYDLIPLRLPNLFPESRRFRERLQRLCRRSAALVAISHQTKHDLVDLLGIDPESVHVIYPGRNQVFSPASAVRLEEIRRRYGIDGPYLLYVGALGPHKNVPTLLRAYQEARLEGGIDAKLVLVGDRRWGTDTLTVLEGLKVRGDVIVTGYVPAEDLPVLYAGSSLFVFPSLYEGFGLPVLEALSSGVPVIVSKAGALPEVVGDAGCCVDPEDPTAMAAAIGRVLRDSALRESMAAAGLKRAASFSWTQSARQVSRLLQIVTDRSQSAAG